MTTIDKFDTQPIAMPNAEWLGDFRRQLLDWFGCHARALPWRGTRDPYVIWVSEVMLQQTQVETVKPYFDRFLKRFPTVRELAAADESEVLRHWEGLGYYRRARQMHRAAQVIVTEHAGEFPRDPSGIAALPGIGRYTTGAIMSLAFDCPEPILEANTIRLFSRLLGYRGDPTKSAGQRLLWQFARVILPEAGCGAVNQAVMELGSLICTPKSPACSDCPVSHLCCAHREQAQDQIPRSSKRPVFEELHEVAVVLRDGDRVLLRRCQPGERWAGLWDYPRFPHPARAAKDPWREIARCVQDRTGIAPTAGVHLVTIRHGVTRFRITLDCYVAEIISRDVHSSTEASHTWVPVHDLETYALNSTGRRISRKLAMAD